jgi:hypothetical protein
MVGMAQTTAAIRPFPGLDRHLQVTLRQPRNRSPNRGSDPLARAEGQSQEGAVLLRLAHYPNPSNCDPLDHIEGDFVAGTIIELRRARAFVSRHGLRVFQRATFLVQPDPPAFAVGIIVLDPHRDDCGGLGVSGCAGRACWAGEDRGLQAEWRRRAVAIPMEMSIAPD